MEKISSLSLYDSEISRGRAYVGGGVYGFSVGKVII